MLKYFISILLITTSLNLSSQENDLLDTIPIKTTYGIKLGIDLSKQIRMLTESNYRGLVITGDYRVFNKLFLAAEFGRNNGEDYYEQLWKTNVIGTKTAIILVIIGTLFGRVDMFVDFAIAYALLNFVGAIVVSRYFNRTVPLQEMEKDKAKPRRRLKA